MHILLTGAAGRIGSHTLFYLLDRGHTVLATDASDLPAEVADRTKQYGSAVTFQQLNLMDIDAVEELVVGQDRSASGRQTTDGLRATRVEGLIHLGSIPSPNGELFKTVHNNNVCGTYNIVSTCASRGVKRIVQASSINAMGVSFQPEGHQVWEELPIDEESPDKPVSDDFFRLIEQFTDSEIAGRPLCSVEEVRDHLTPCVTVS